MSDSDRFEAIGGSDAVFPGGGVLKQLLIVCNKL